MEGVAGHAARAFLDGVRASHMILPLRPAFLAASVRPEIVIALAGGGRCRVRIDETPDQRSLGQVEIARQKQLAIERVGKTEDILGLTAKARMALAAHLILLIKRQVLQAMHDQSRVVFRIKLGAGSRLLLGYFDVLAARSVATLTTNIEFSIALHAPVHRPRRRPHRRKVESCGVATHALLLGKASNWQLAGFARDHLSGIVRPNPILRLKVAHLPESRGLAGALIGVYRPPNRGWKEEVTGIAFRAAGPDMVGLLPFSANNQGDFVFLPALRRARILWIDNDKEVLPVGALRPDVELDRHFLQCCQIGIAAARAFDHRPNILEGYYGSVEVAQHLGGGEVRDIAQDLRMPRLAPLIDLNVVTSGAAASSAADIGCSIEIILTRCDARPGPKELDRFLGA